MRRTYPQSLAGSFEADYISLILRPIKLVNTEITDYNLTEIRFENGIGNAVFENGFVYFLEVKFNERSFSYTFNYKKACHIFEINAHLGGLCTTVDIMSLTDFSEVPED